VTSVESIAARQRRHFEIHFALRLEESMESGLNHFTKKYGGSRKLAVNETINNDDEMYLFLVTVMGAARAKIIYYKLGSELTRTIMQIANWRFAGRTDRIKMMEFACGYGRNLRHIVHCIPAKNVFVSDIYENAVNFNIEQFGVHGRVSVHNPSELAWAERFDLIVVPSLFSHLPESTFAGWIAALYKLLTDDGILVFSVHDDHLLSPGLSMPESGIRFTLESESSTLDKSEYGSTYVTEAFVRAQIRKGTGDAEYSRTKRGFWNHQDFYLIANDPRADVTSFRYDYGTVANLDRIDMGNDRSLKLRGWAKDTARADKDGPRIEVYLDGLKIGESNASNPREDVADAWGDDFIDSGFEFDVPSLPSRLRRESLLVVEAVSSGHRECLHALSLGDSLPDIGQEIFDVIPLQGFRNRIRALAKSGGRRWTQVWRQLRGA
jgi:Methyltransferase domain